MSIVLSNYCWVEAVKGNGKTKPQGGDVVAVEEDMTIRQNKSPYQGRGSRGNDSCRLIAYTSKQRKTLYWHIGPGLLDDEGNTVLYSKYAGNDFKGTTLLESDFQNTKNALAFLSVTNSSKRYGVLPPGLVVDSQTKLISVNELKLPVERRVVADLNMEQKDYEDEGLPPGWDNTYQLKEEVEHMLTPQLFQQFHQVVEFGIYRPK
ncbi:unnamed protein product [Lactuca virosa]|uniref:Uncharacterized protein n=1 Tax=Lactuca virosa TaxID=75947 RepID=A0AAU9LI70_9ASTR|nr:unnamed protein product [Lactuca virosa]